DALLLRNVGLTPEEKYALVQVRSNPPATSYGHGNNKVDNARPTSYTPTSRAFRAHLKSRSSGTVQDHKGIAEQTLKHEHHASSHTTHVSAEHEAIGIAHFFRWHMDAAPGRAPTTTAQATSYTSRGIFVG
ncbi:hypothetical protein BDZ89DRAFT_948444, partial [Hymenopellis radicata]